MGSCVSGRGEDRDPAMQFRSSLGTKAGEVLAPASPAAVGGAQIGSGLPAGGFDPKGRRVDASLRFRSPGPGSQDEAFFDSQAWLESDCEDDFVSVDGDRTPSHGSTLNHLTGSTAQQQQPKITITFDGFSYSKSEPSPRKTLAELLEETMTGEGNEHIADGKRAANDKSVANKMIMDLLPNSLDGTPYLSGANSICSDDRTPADDLRNRKEKRRKAQCCLPSLVHSFSFNDRKKQTPSPGHHSGG